MWNSLRSDLKEFASSVASDGTNVLETLDSKLKVIPSTEETTEEQQQQDQQQRYNALMTVDPELAYDCVNDEADEEINSNEINEEGKMTMFADAEAQEEALRRMEMEVTYLTPLLDNDNENVNVGVDGETEEAHSSNTNDDNDDNDDNEEEQIRLFVSNFNIQSKTDEITSLLTTYPILSKHFTNFVPTQVTYEQFWLRYYYRCNVDIIMNEWKEEEEERLRKRKELMDIGVNFGKNFFWWCIKYYFESFSICYYYN